MIQLSASPLLRNLMAVASGTAAGQVVVLAFSPLITRIYSPEAFGLQGVFLALLSILSPLIALRYPMAIVVAANERAARNLARLAAMIAFGFSLLFGLALLLAREPMLVLLGAQSLGALILFLPLALFCTALLDITGFQAARLGHFRLVGIVSVVQAFVTNLARVLGGLVTPVAGTLVAITSTAPLLQAGLLAIGNRHETRGADRLTRREAMALLRKHRDFPLFRAPTDVLSAVAQTVPVILLAALFSPAAAGLYTLARSVVNVPLNVVGGAVGDVYYTRFSTMARAGNPLYPLVLRATLSHLLLLGLPVLLAALLFPALFALAFGEAWRTAGEYAGWMTLWIVGMLANIPTVRVLPVIGRQDMHLVFNAVIAAAGIATILAARQSDDSAATAVAWYSVATAIFYGLQIVTYLALTRHHDRRTAR